MKALISILFAVVLSGCASYDSYGYRDDGYYEDRYSGDRYYAETVPRYRSGYGYRSAYGSGGYPDYVLWSDYYSVLWPVYRGYYDPFYSPGFYYGVTWYPHSYFGLGSSWYSWPYYQAYSPYRYSYWDGYYDHWDRRRGEISNRVAHGRSATVNHPYLYGSARNEAQQLALQSGIGRSQQGARPGLQYDPYAARRTTPLRDDGLRGNDRNAGAMSDAAPADARSRARLYDRGSVRPSDRGTGWAAGVPSERRPAADVSGTRVPRSAPYYRDVGGSRVPVTRPQRDPAPEYQRATPNYRIERDVRDSGEASPRDRVDYRSAPERSDMQSMQRQSAPSRASAPVQRYEAPSRTERPSRDADSGFSRSGGERSGNDDSPSDSARGQLRRGERD